MACVLMLFSLNLVEDRLFMIIQSRIRWVGGGRGIVGMLHKHVLVLETFLPLFIYG